MPALVRAFRDDIVENGTFLSDKDLNVAAHRMEQRVRLYDGPVPDGYVLHRSSDRGNDCGLHSLMKVAQFRTNAMLGSPTGDLPGATEEEVRFLREAIAEAVTPEEVETTFVSALKSQAARNGRHGKPRYHGDLADRPVTGFREKFWTKVDEALDGRTIAVVPPTVPFSRSAAPGEPGFNVEGGYRILGGMGAEGEAPGDVALHFNGDHFDLLIRDEGRGGA